MELYYKQESYNIIGAALHVYNVLGPGFVEAVYQEALEIEFQKLGIPYEREKEIDLYYDGQMMKIKFRPDFVCYDKIILELKAVKVLLPEHEAQLQNYLKATSMRLGLLINFCHMPKVEIKRIVL